jgi:putative ABC transport system ATP-binding protein
MTYRVRGVRKSYGGTQVLDGFDLDIETGEMVALTGVSGSGKSTVLNILGLLETPDAGEVQISQERAPSPRSRAARRYLRERLGYLFQNFALIDSATVRENLDVALTYTPRSSQKQQRIAEALAHVGLAGIEERKVYSLSGGEQQRIAAARLLIKPCDIVLADEPTGALDSGNRDVVLGLLKELNASGKTVVIATHDGEVADACERSIVIGGER